MSSEQSSHIITMHDILELGDDLTLPEDQELFNKKVDEKLSACFLYDVVMGAFIARLYKPDKIESGIGLRLDVLRMINKIFPRLDVLVNKYETRDMLDMTYSIQIANEIYLTVGQNSAKYGGKKFIDIREHFRSEQSDKLIPSKVGIRFPLDIVTKFKSLVKDCMDQADMIMDKSRELYRGTKLFLVEREIREAQLITSDCGDCTVEHFSALRHKKSGKCTIQATWEETVDQFFTDAVQGVVQSEVIRLAKLVSKRTGEITFCTQELKEVDDEELKHSVKAILKPRKGCKIYRHLTDIIEEEEEEKAQQRLEQDQDTDICDEEDDQPSKKKLKVEGEEGEPITIAEDSE